MASSGQSFGFFVRTLRPLIMLALLLSIAINVFLVSHSPFPVHKEEATGSGSVSLALGDEAFGKVDRGFSLQPQTVDAEGKALPPVGSYVVTSGLLQPIPNVLQLYRDQGIRLDTTWLQNLIGSLGAPINMAKNPLLPQQYIFRTVDGQYDVSLFLDDRRMIVRRIAAPVAPAGAVAATDQDVTAVAIAFASQFDIDALSLGTSKIVERPVSLGGPMGTFVVWNAQFDGHPLLNTSMQPIEMLAIQVGRLSKTPVSLTYRLLFPSMFSHAAYSTATTPVLAAALGSGGVLPVAGTKGKKVTVTYNNADLVYVLYRGDATHPTYILPAVRATFELPSGFQSATFVPALDPSLFAWFVSVVPAAPLGASSSVASSVKSASGSTK